jgi:hypothetical protein
MNQQMQTHMRQAVARGETMCLLSQINAEQQSPGFSMAAKEAMIERLRAGDATGEELTNYCIDRGIKPLNQKSFGGPISSLSRNKQIFAAGFGRRTKGHGTHGAILWRLAA